MMPVTFQVILLGKHRKKLHVKTVEMAQWVEVFVTKPDDLSWIPRSHMG